MRILYGVVGEGMGHAMRSRIVIEHLARAGHDVEIVASDRAINYLRRFFREVHAIHGFHIVTEENRVRKGSTLWENVRDGVAALPTQIAAYFELISDFRPEVVVSDFESWTYLYGKLHRLPVISIDNMQVINRCEHPPEITEGKRAEFELTKAFIKSKLPFCDHYLVTTFFRAEVRKAKTTLVPPILRPEIVDARRRARSGEHLLVYQTAEGHDDLAAALVRTGLPCLVYGMRRAITQDQVEGNLRYRPFSEMQFIEDLSTARAVLTGGGFTLISEAVYLNKPVLSIPIRGQFEQVINGRYLEREGFGQTAEIPDQRVIQHFVESLPALSAKVATYQQNGNQVLFQELDGKLDRIAAGV